MTKASEQALSHCQKIGMVTMFSETNEGMSLPLEISKKIAIIAINQICPESNYWVEVKWEINKL